MVMMCVQEKMELVQLFTIAVEEER